MSAQTGEVGFGGLALVVPVVLLHPVDPAAELLDDARPAAHLPLRGLLEDLDDVKETFDPDSFVEQIGMVKNNGLFEVPEDQPDGDTETARKYAKWLPAVFEKYQSALRAANTLDFDDLLLLTLRLWREHPRILARYQKRLRYVMAVSYTHLTLPTIYSV